MGGKRANTRTHEWEVSLQAHTHTRARTYTHRYIYIYGGEEPTGRQGPTALGRGGRAAHPTDDREAGPDSTRRTGRQGRAAHGGPGGRAWEVGEHRAPGAQGAAEQSRCGPVTYNKKLMSAAAWAAGSAERSLGRPA